MTKKKLYRVWPVTFTINTWRS